MMRATERDLRILTDERQAKFDDLKRINEELRQSERRRERMRLEEEKVERQAELERRADNKQVLSLDEQRREHATKWALKHRMADQNYEMLHTNFQRAYAPSIAALNAALIMNSVPVRGFSPSTSVPHPLTGVPNPMIADSAGWNPTTSVGVQLPAVANPAVALSQTTAAAEVVTNLSSSAGSTRPSPTAVLSAPAYIPPARRHYADLRPIHSLNLNVTRSQTEGTLRTSATVVSMATIGNPPPTLNPHVIMNTRVGDNYNQGAQRNIMQH